ncbi:MAG: hypothetical protein P1U74_07245 [Legionellaceae bacterium]|nr:hypothetical protein [Legionellaceae bacterium]
MANKVNVSENIKKYLDGKNRYLTRGHRMFFGYVARIFWNKYELSQDIAEANLISDLNEEQDDIQDLLEESGPNVGYQLNGTLKTYFMADFSTGKDLKDKGEKILANMSAEERDANLALLNRIYNYRLSRISLKTGKSLEDLVPAILANIRTTVEFDMRGFKRHGQVEGKKLSTKQEIMLSIQAYIDGVIDYDELRKNISAKDHWGFTRFFSRKIKRSLHVIDSLRVSEIFNDRYNEVGRAKPIQSGSVSVKKLQKVQEEKRMVEDEKDHYLDIIEKSAAETKKLQDILRDPELGYDAKDEEIDKMFSSHNIPQETFVETMTAVLKRVEENYNSFVSVIASDLGKGIINKEESEQILDRVSESNGELKSFIESEIKNATNPDVQYQTNCASVWKFLNQIHKKMEHKDPDAGSHNLVTAPEMAYRNSFIPSALEVLGSIPKSPKIPEKHISSTIEVKESIRKLQLRNAKMRLTLTELADQFQSIQQGEMHDDIINFITTEISASEDDLAKLLKEVEGITTEQFDVLSDHKLEWQENVCKIARLICDNADNLERDRSLLFNYKLKGDKSGKFSADLDKNRIFVPTYWMRDRSLSANDFASEYKAIYLKLPEDLRKKIKGDHHNLDSYAFGLSDSVRHVPDLGVLDGFKQEMIELSNKLGNRDRENWMTFISDMDSLRASKFTVLGKEFKDQYSPWFPVVAESTSSNTVVVEPTANSYAAASVSSTGMYSKSGHVSGCTTPASELSGEEDESHMKSEEIDEGKPGPNSIRGQ